MNTNPTAQPSLTCKTEIDDKMGKKEVVNKQPINQYFLPALDRSDLIAVVFLPTK